MHTAVGFLVPNVALRTLFVGVKKRRGILRFSTSHSLFVSKQKIISGKEERTKERGEELNIEFRVLLCFSIFCAFFHLVVVPTARINHAKVVVDFQVKRLRLLRCRHRCHFDIRKVGGRSQQKNVKALKMVHFYCQSSREEESRRN